MFQQSIKNNCGALLWKSVLVKKMTLRPKRVNILYVRGCNAVAMKMYCFPIFKMYFLHRLNISERPSSWLLSCVITTGVTWYLCDDMIYFWLSPLILYPMWSNPLKGALAWWSVWTVAFTFGPMYVTGRHGVGFNGDLVAGVTDEVWYFQGRGAIPTFYSAPWIRFQPYLVGILVGYILHR